MSKNNEFIQAFPYSIRSDIKNIYDRRSEMTSRVEINLELDSGQSTRITNWSDGYGVVIYGVNHHVLINRWPLSLEEAQKIVSGWRAK